jgi:hypothetical protein
MCAAAANERVRKPFTSGAGRFGRANHAAPRGRSLAWRVRDAPPMTKMFWPALVALVLGGCSSPAIGDWTYSLGGENAALELAEGYSGEATIYWFSNPGPVNQCAACEPVRAEFDVEWEETDDQIVVDLQCKAGPNGNDCVPTLDFEMERSLDDAEEELECDGDGIWAEFAFEWKRD